MITHKQHLRLERERFFSDHINLFVGVKHDNGRIDLPKRIEWEMIEPTACIPEQHPILTLNPTEAQRLMDELWNLGIRPTEGHGSTGQLAATEKHLTHVSHLLDLTLTTTLNVVNAGLVTQHKLPIAP